jgi:hypothetical protein
MEQSKTIKRGQMLVSAGEYGPVWCITEGMFRLERMGHDGLSLVQLGLVLQLATQVSDLLLTSSSEIKFWWRLLRSCRVKHMMMGSYLKLSCLMSEVLSFFLSFDVIHY